MFILRIKVQRNNQEIKIQIEANTKSQVRLLKSNKYSKQSNWRGGPAAPATPLRIKPF